MQVVEQTSGYETMLRESFKAGAHSPVFFPTGRWKQIGVNPPGARLRMLPAGLLPGTSWEILHHLVLHRVWPVTSQGRSLCEGIDQSLLETSVLLTSSLCHLAVRPGPHGLLLKLLQLGGGDRFPRDRAPASPGLSEPGRPEAST